MFKGKATNELLESCFEKGLCEAHKNEYEYQEKILEKQDVGAGDCSVDFLSNKLFPEAQRNAFLFFRLKSWMPVLNNKALNMEKLNPQINQSQYMSLLESFKVPLNDFRDLSLLDSVVVFALCHFSKICCVGALFLSKETPSSVLQSLLSKKKLEKNDLNFLIPVLDENFEGFDKDIVKMCFVRFLVIVRNISLSLTMKSALEFLQSQIYASVIPAEVVLWMETGKNALDERKYDEAIEAFNRALNYRPCNVEGLEFRGQAFFEKGNYAQAGIDFYILLIIRPICLKMLTQLINSLLGSTLITEATILAKYGLKITTEEKKIQYFQSVISNSGISDEVCAEIADNVTAIATDLPELVDETDSDSDFQDSLDSDLRQAEQNDPNLTSNPEMVRQLFEPLIQSLFSNPEALSDKTVISQMKPIMESNPEIKHLLKNPDLLRRTIEEKMHDPAMVQDVINYIERDPVIKQNLNKTSPDVLRLSVEELLRSPGMLQEVIQDAIQNQDWALNNTEHNQMHVKEEISHSNKRRHGIETSEDNEAKRKSLKSSLKEASISLCDNFSAACIQHFQSALNELKAFPQIYTLQECEVICIKYACAVAFCKSGGYEDLKKSICIYKEILEEHDIIFPAAYYSMAVSFYKLNKFKDALNSLRKVCDILEKGIHFKVYTWPGTERVIKETKKDNLRGLVTELLEDCERPHPPDAVCRLGDCSFEPAIYYSDPGFKGFSTVYCSEHCVMQFHPKCWKCVRADKSYSDKEFLDSKCFTPDCNGVITKVESISKEGTIDKMFTSIEDKKSIKQKKTKLEKKLDSKEERKRRRHDSVSRSGSEPPDVIASESITPVELEKPDEVPISTSNVFNKSVLEPKNIEAATSTTFSSLPVNTESFTILKKEDFFDAEVPTKVNKRIKEKKTKNTLYLTEFCGNTDPYVNQCVDNQRSYNTYNNDIDEADSYPTYPYSQEFPTQVSKEFNNSVTLESENGDVVIECTRKNAYRFFENLLARIGPLHIDDPRLLSELSNQSIEINLLISEFGGIVEFLKQNMDFAVVRNTYVCLTVDMPQAYAMCSEEYPTSDSSLPACSPTNLNPFAAEYKPSALPKTSLNPSSTNVHNSPELISAISKLRQPLSLDNEHAHMNGNKQNIKPQAAKKLKFDTSSDSSELSEMAMQNGNSLPDDETSAKVNVALKRCSAVVKLFFSEELKEYRDFINNELKPYKILHCKRKKNRLIQTEVETLSQGTMKNDEELEERKQYIEDLESNYTVLEEQIKILEAQLDSCRDCLIKHKNESSMEILSLKKQLDNAYEELEDQKKIKNANDIERDATHKQLVERLNSAQESLALQTLEKDKLFYTNERYSNEIKVKEINMKEIQKENELLKSAIEHMTEEFENRLKKEAEEKLNIKNRIKRADLSFLDLKKKECSMRIEMKVSEAHQRIKDLQAGIHLTSNNLNPVLKTQFESLQGQIQKYIVLLQETIRIFVTAIDKQIHAIKNGATLESMEPVVIRDLPQLPGFPGLPNNANFAQANPFLPHQMPMVNSVNHAVLQPTAMANQPPLTPTTIMNSTPHPLLLPMAVNNSSRPLGPAMSVVNIPLHAQVGVSHTSIPNTTSRAPPGISNSNPPNVTNSNPPNVTVSGADQQISQPPAPVVDELKTPGTATPNESEAGSTKSIDSASAEATTKLQQHEKSAEIEDRKSASAALPKTSTTGYEKLLSKLKKKHPSFTLEELMSFVKEFRRQRNKGLSGLAIDNIVKEVSAIIDVSRKAQSSTTVKAVVGGKTLVIKKLTLDQFQTVPVPEEPKKNPWGFSEEGSSKAWSGKHLDDECTICFEQMNGSAYKADCGHTFHLGCLREWLRNKSDCPICRVYLLLPEDFPAL